MAPWHIVVLLIIVFVLFGGSLLPKLAKRVRQTGEGIAEAGKNLKGGIEEGSPNPDSRVARAAGGAGRGLRSAGDSVVDAASELRTGVTGEAVHEPEGRLARAARTAGGKMRETGEGFAETGRAFRDGVTGAEEAPEAVDAEVIEPPRTPPPPAT